MLMTSFIFFTLVAVTGAVLFIENKQINSEKHLVQVQKATLLAASFLFIAYVDVCFVLILALQAMVTWFCAKDKKRIKFGIAAMVLCLGVFKYTNFFYTSFATLFGADEVILLKIILPLGISFYTFSAIGYMVDVKRGKQEARGWVDLMLYLSFFPKLTSGPIQKSGDFFRQTDQPRCICWSGVSAGVQIFALGLFKKLVLADRLSVFVNQVYAAPAVFSGATVLLAAVSYSLQIYFDFSGYSDMAIGVGRLLDVSLPRNFNLPYLSHNVTELWKRWHMTLSAWLQEYLYLPLGGNRKGTCRTYLNLILTMVIGGIWHGANWTYIFWGLLHGVGLAIHKIWTRITGSNRKEHSVPANICAVIVTFLFTTFCWIFFRADSVSHAVQIISQIILWKNGVWQPYVWTFAGAAVLVISSLFACAQSRENKKSLVKKNQSYVTGFYPTVNLCSFWGLVAFFTFCGLILAFAYTGGSPFIYGAY